MHGDFCWRQSEDEPTVAYVDVRQLQGVAQKSAVSLWILAVDDRMRSRNHDCPRPKSVIVAARRHITAAWQRGSVRATSGGSGRGRRAWWRRSTTTSPKSGTSRSSTSKNEVPRASPPIWSGPAPYCAG